MPPLHREELQTPPPTPPLEGEGRAHGILAADKAQILPSLQGEGLGVGSVMLPDEVESSTPWSVILPDEGESSTPWSVIYFFQVVVFIFHKSIKKLKCCGKFAEND